MRITPAGAGKTTKLRQEVLAALDHPRRCGENGIPRNQGHLRAGSPPQVRGKLPQFVILPEQVGITPAGAGKTGTHAGCRPRGVGSPPQVRGKLPCIVLDASASGITPAGAGKTEDWKSKYEKEQDHPRRCGENEDAARKKTDAEGSPPQVRGKPDHRPRQGTVCGITPAGAGKTYMRQQNTTITKDHPRRCGENASNFTPASCAMGSPPQVRGKLRACLAVAQGRRITPAGAGKTAQQDTHHQAHWDHPRRCGEN